MTERLTGPIVLPAGKRAIVHHLLGRSFNAPSLYEINGKSYGRDDTHFSAAHFGGTYGALLGPFPTDTEIVLGLGAFGGQMYTNRELAHAWVVEYSMLTKRWTVGWNVEGRETYDDAFTEISVLDSVQGGAAAPRLPAELLGLSVRVIPVDEVRTLASAAARPDAVTPATARGAGGGAAVASSLFLPGSGGVITRVTVAPTPLSGEHLALNEEISEVSVGSPASRDVGPTAGSWIFEKWFYDWRLGAARMAVLSTGELIAVNNFGVYRVGAVADANGGRSVNQIASFPRYMGGPQAGQRVTYSGAAHVDPTEENVYVALSQNVLPGQKFITNLVRVSLSSGAMSVVAGDEAESSGFEPTPARDGTGSGAHINVLGAMAPVDGGFAFADSTEFAGNFAIRKVTYGGTVTTLTAYEYPLVPAIAYRPGEIVFAKQDGERHGSGAAYLGAYSFMSLTDTASRLGGSMDRWGGIVPSDMVWDPVSKLFFVATSQYVSLEDQNRRAAVWAVNLAGEDAPYDDFRMEPFVGHDVITSLSMGPTTRETTRTTYIPFGVLGRDSVVLGPPVTGSVAGNASSSVTAASLRVTPRN